MKLLIDQNLSRHLVGQLRAVFPESEHVTALDLDAATDGEVWEFARDHGSAILGRIILSTGRRRGAASRVGSSGSLGGVPRALLQLAALASQLPSALNRSLELRTVANVPVTTAGDQELWHVDPLRPRRFTLGERARHDPALPGPSRRCS